MKEIKFRAWDGEKLWRWYEIAHQLHEVIHKAEQGKTTLLQFTGMIDGKGNDIYEGDLIAISEIYGDKSQTFEVIWGGEEYPGFDLKGWPNDEVNGLSELAQSGDWRYEVVGNIFTTPNLVPAVNKS